MSKVSMSFVLRITYNRIKRNRNTQMKKLILGFSLVWVTLASGQTEFVIKEEGISPKSISVEMSAFTATQLYDNTNQWIEENSETYNLAIERAAENASIHLSSLKGNAVLVEKQYYNMEFKITIRFEAGRYSFEPTQVRLKLNSKYDMGWKDFDINNGSLYFKKGKLIRKYASYLENITVALNELHSDLSTHLKLSGN